jgi:hypothetical protein
MIMKQIESQSSELVIDDFGDEYIQQVRTLASLGYSPDRIAMMLRLSGKRKAMLLLRINAHGDTYNTAFKEGFAIGEYNIDSELAKQAEKGDIDSIELLERRKNDRIELDLRKELFGI